MFAAGGFPTMALLQFAMNNYKPKPKQKIIRQEVLDKFNDKEQRSTMKINELNVNELKALCKQRGLLCGGNKMQLLTRLMQHDLNPEDPSLPKKRKRASAEEEREAKKARLAKMSDEQPTGVWAQKCIKKWNLLAPYDTDISETQWEAYYNERIALDVKSTTKAEADSDDEDCTDCSAKVLKQSRADLRLVVKGIKHLDNLDALLNTLENGLYVINDYVNWEDEDDPRTVATEMRLYSPIGNGSSVQFKYDYHCRPRMSFIEYFVSLYGAIRTPVMLGKPQLELRRTQARKLFDKSHNDRKRKFDRTIPSAICLKNYEDALFGTVGKISSLKMLKVIGSAAGCDTHGESEFCDWVLRMAIRDKKMKMNQDEVSDAEDEVDNDDANSNCTEPPSHNSDEDSDGEGGGFFGFPMTFF